MFLKKIIFSNKLNGVRLSSKANKQELLVRTFYDDSKFKLYFHFVYI